MMKNKLQKKNDNLSHIFTKEKSTSNWPENLLLKGHPVFWLLQNYRCLNILYEGMNNGGHRFRE